MLTFEKILKVFQAYLDDDPLYEVVQTSHGYTLMAWEPHRNDWYSAEILVPRHAPRRLPRHADVPESRRRL